MITWNEMIQLQASQGSVESRPNTLNLKVKKGKKEVGVAYMPGRSEPLPLPPATRRASLLPVAGCLLSVRNVRGAQGFRGHRPLGFGAGYAQGLRSAAEGEGQEEGPEGGRENPLPVQLCPDRSVITNFLCRNSHYDPWPNASVTVRVPVFSVHETPPSRSYQLVVNAACQSIQRRTRS